MTIQDGVNRILSYGNGGFSFAGYEFKTGNVFTAYKNKSNFVRSFNGGLTVEDLSFLKEYKGHFEYLVIGCGSGFINPSIELRKFIKQDCGFALEFVNTTFACHTWNDLVEQGDSVLAILLAID